MPVRKGKDKIKGGKTSAKLKKAMRFIKQHAAYIGDYNGVVGKPEEQEKKYQKNRNNRRP